MFAMLAGPPAEAGQSPVQLLEQRVGASWKTLAEARRRALETRTRLTDALAGIPSSDLSVVAFGSLARDEFTPGSDVDWTLLIDGTADTHHFDLAQEIRGVVAALRMKQPGREGQFGAMTFSHELVHLIGGQDDTNSNTTRRILLLLESVALGQGAAHERVITGTLSRYLLEERTFARDSKPLHVPRFLLNDFARYWRTMAVDFAYKSRTRLGEGSALRNLKLRMSRKLIFVSGLLSCFSCQLGMARAGGHAGCPAEEEECVVCLRAFMRRTPLEIFAQTALYLAEKNPAKAAQILAFAEKAVTAYDKFLAILADERKREHLEKLAQADIDSDPLFAEARAISHEFRDGVDGFFFDGDADLAKLTRHYGVF